MPFLILLLIWPFAELSLLIHAGSRIGVFNTIMLCVLSAAIGSLLVQGQGFRTILSARQSATDGKLPVQEIFDGFCIFIAGILLIIPGFISDGIGLCLLMPPVRHALRLALSRYFKGEDIIVKRHGPPPSGTAIEGEFTRLDEEGKPLLNSNPQNHQEQL
jgi:UPF0716 protein FxsA